jgi:hypothetical protein
MISGSSETLFNDTPLLFLPARNKPIFTKKSISITTGGYKANSTKIICE